MGGERLRVLVVEDEPLIASGIVCCLEELEYEAAGVISSGMEVVPFVQAHSVDLILMDINLPELNGIAAMERLNEYANIPCIFITGYSDDEFIRRAQSQSTYGYLIKPVDVRDLKAAINTAMARFDEYQKVQSLLDKAKNELVERKLVERAKGILMDSFDMSESKAMRCLQEKSRKSNRKLADVAKSVIDAAARMNE